MSLVVVVAAMSLMEYKWRLQNFYEMNVNEKKKKKRRDLIWQYRLSVSNKLSKIMNLVGGSLTTISIPMDPLMEYKKKTYIWSILLTKNRMLPFSHQRERERNLCRISYLLFFLYVLRYIYSCVCAQHKHRNLISLRDTNLKYTNQHGGNY